MYRIFIKKIKIIALKELINFIKTIKNTFFELDKKIIKILKYGLWFCFVIAFLGSSILFVNLTYVHSQNFFEIGFKTFQISLYYTVFFITSAITVNFLHRNLI